MSRVDFAPDRTHRRKSQNFEDTPAPALPEPKPQGRPNPPPATRSSRMEDMGAPAKPSAKASDSPKKTAPAAKANSYPTYRKDSAEAKDFRGAFADARKSGKSEFTWQGRRYNTKTK